MVEEFTISSLLQKGIDILGEGDYFNPLLDAQILLMHILKVDKLYLYTNSKDPVDERAVEEFLELINLRQKRYPIQYILGKQEFMGLDFKVREGVLVPRPDTEVLVEKIIDIVEDGYFKKNTNENINIVDIGTGSGAITLSLAHFLKNTFVYSVDISETALGVAKENAKLHDLSDRVKFLKGSLLDPLDDENLKGKVDILVSNPPYIPSKVIEELQVEVSTYEPKLALDGGEDGLDFYREIINKSDDFLAETSIIAFEIGHDQGKTIKDLLRENGKFDKISVICDLSGTDRVVIGEKK